VLLFEEGEVGTAEMGAGDEVVSIVFESVVEACGCCCCCC
jgi:hypothetical protein